MQNNFTWYLKFHAGGPTIFSQVAGIIFRLYIYIYINCKVTNKEIKVSKKNYYHYYYYYYYYYYYHHHYH